MYFSLHHNIVTLTDDGLAIPQLKLLTDLKYDHHTKTWLEYIFFVYDKNSPYKNILLDSRKKIVCADRFKASRSDLYIEIEKHEEVQHAIMCLTGLQYTHTEKLIEGVNRKIEEYLNFWNDTKIDSKNHELLKDTLDNSEKLLKLKERLDRINNNEKSAKQVGGGTSKLFENGD
jgi:hypothetical protein